MSASNRVIPVVVDERALAEVEGVGERIAGKIEWAVKETSAGYI